MGGWTTTRVSKPAFVVDPASINLSSGRQWAWADVSSSYQNSEGDKFIPAGTVYAEKANGQMVPRAASTTLTSVVVASNVATATKTSHGYSVGDVVYISGSNLAYANGTKTILSVADANTFTYEATGSNATATGTILANRSARGITVSNATENSKSDSASGYGTIVGGNLYENLLPEATGTPKVLSDQVKTELNANGTGFAFEQYQDTRAD